MDESILTDNASSAEGQEPTLTSWPPPPTNDPPVIQGAIHPVFTPIYRLSRAIVFMLGGYAFVSVLGFGGAVISMPTLTRQIEVAIIALVQGLLLIATGLCFLVWMYRMDRNLRAFGVEGLRYTPAWAVAFFFIPIMTLYRPFQALREIWQASEPVLEARAGKTWRNINPPILLGIWWVSFLLINFVDALSAGDLGTTDIDAIDNAVSFVSALLALQMVRLFTARQGQTAKSLSLNA